MPRRVAVISVVVVVALGSAVAVSFTKPFTLGADLLTAVALVAMLVAQFAVEIRSCRAGRSTGADTAYERPARRLRAYVVWIAVCVAFTALELFTYFRHPRSSYPTFSSLSDELSASHGGRAFLFVAWLALGWLFLSASARRSRTES
jgi:hypothetical protein